MPRVIVDPRFGLRLYALRTDRGMSLRVLAKLALSNKTSIQEFETGLKFPTQDTARRLDEALDAGGELASLVRVVDQEKRGRLPRREFVSAAAGLAVGLPHVPDLAGGRHLGPGTVNRLGRRTARLRRLDDFLGGADTYRVYASELEATTTLVREGTYTQATGRGLLTLLAEQAQMAGFSAFDAGWLDEAERLYRLSHAVALDANDRSLAGNALASMAYQALAFGRSGVDLATTSCDTAGSDASCGVRTLLLERRAWAHAMAGDADETERCLDLAEVALNQQDNRPDPDWVFWVDHIELRIMTGRCWSALRRPMRAISVLEDVLAGYEDTHARDKARYLSWLADAYADANEVEQACAVAGRAMDLASGVGSIRPQQRVEAVIRRLDPQAALPHVADIRARCAE